MDKENEAKTDINVLIARSLAGRISDSERAELEQWLSRSPKNARRYKALAKANDLTSRYRRYASVDEKRAWRRFKQRHITTHGKRVAMRIMRYAAALLVLVVSATALRAYFAYNGQRIDEAVQTAMQRSVEMGKQKAVLTLPSGDSTLLLTATNMNDASLVGKIIRNFSRERSGQRNKLSTYRDSEYWITLSDGTLVHLNGGTTLVYPEHFGSQERAVSLDGEAYFQVVHDEGRPFRIHTPHGVVTDYGTAFNVNTRVNHGTEVVLVEGKAGVKPVHGSETILEPGQLAYFNKQESMAEIDNVDVSPFVSWNKGSFKFKDCPLEKLMEVISHWYGLNVKYGSDDIRRIRFTGDIDRYESARPVLKAIEVSTNGLKVEQDGDVFILKRK